PGPPTHPILGHLISIGKVAMKIPQRAHPHTLAAYMMREYDLPPVFFMDTRPVSSLNLIVADPSDSPEIGRQISESGLKKHPSLGEVIEPLAGKMNMLSTDGVFWKKWRSIFNPGFSIQQVVSQVPAIVECGQSFIKLLDEHAKADRVFRLEEETTKITIDVIGKVVCDHDFRTLSSDNEFMTTMRKTLSWMPDMQSINPFHTRHPLRPIYWWYYKKKMDKYIGKVLDERFAGREAKPAKKARTKTGIDLALQEYFKENGQDVDSENVTMDAEFRKAAIDNLLILLFAGHDTTASTLCYCYHILSKHPDKLARLRQELDSVFGVGKPAGDQLKATPYLVNQLDYTLAVIKEILRLWPPASGVRIGRKGFFIKDPVSGELIDTDGLLIWTVSMAMHRDKRIWGADVDDFKPERFLPENASKLPADAWRPFEKGPRNCIGQELALIEMKVVLAMTVREFDFKAAKGPMEVYGERMHQILLAAAKPSEGMPARVYKREV
ncbi:cytochrome P450, partial [Setomelanomma holmii]